MTLPTSCSASTSPHFRRVSPAEFRSAYLSGARLADIGAKFGLCAKAVARRASRMDLPPRSHNTKKPTIRGGDEKIFQALWNAGVGMPELAAFFGVDRRTISNTRERMGLQKRIPGTRPKMTIAQFVESRLRQRMEQTAMLDQSAFINAEMVDRIGNGKIKHVGVVR